MGGWYGEVTWGVSRVKCARRLTRRPAPSSCGAGGRGGGASRWRRGGRQSQTPLLPPPPPPPLLSPPAPHPFTDREKLFFRRVRRGK